MDLDILKPLLGEIRGCTFATLDARTFPKPGIACYTSGERVLLYRTNGVSGYENKVRKALAEAGKDPSKFVVGPLPWGERVDGLPLIAHKGKFFLQTIQLAVGQKTYSDTLTEAVLDDAMLAAYGIRDSFPSNQGLPPGSEVLCKAWNISGITKLTLMGETLADSSVATPREILRLNYSKVDTNRR